MNGPQTPSAKRRTLEILQDLEAVRENLLGLSDEIWLSIDHNDQEALSEGVAFKQHFNAKAAEFDRSATELSELIQGYTTIRLDADEDTGGQDSDTHDRVIADLNRETPHSIDEDFTFKRPYGFLFQGRPVANVTTWQRVYELICRQIFDENPDRFRTLFDHPDFVSRRGNRTFQNHPAGLRKALRIDEDVYAEANLSANGIRDVIRALLNTFDISEDTLTIYLRQDRGAGVGGV